MEGTSKMLTSVDLIIYTSLTKGGSMLYMNISARTKLI